MRKELEKKGLKGVKVLEGEASNMAGVKSQSVDAVIAAQVRPLKYTAPLVFTNIGAICRHFIGMAAIVLLFDPLDYSC